MIKAVLFDMDGTLIDACDWHYEAFNQALSEIAGFSITPEENKIHYNGLPTAKKLEKLISDGRINPESKQDIWKRKQELTIEIINNKSWTDPTKIELLTYLNKIGIKVACVTNSIYATASLMLQKANQFNHLDLIVTNDMIRYPKPHGEGFIRAMVQFGTLPEETLIVEDSPKGQEAARSTGAHLWECVDATEVTLINYKNKVVGL